MLMKIRVVHILQESIIHTNVYARKTVYIFRQSCRFIILSIFAEERFHVASKLIDPEIFSELTKGGSTTGFLR